MNLIANTRHGRALETIRNATREAHHRLEYRLDAVTRFADPARRQDMIQRYAAFHVPADRALAGELVGVRDLNFERRRRAHLFDGVERRGALPPFPLLGTRAEALGLLYVLEGSALGGRLILRALADQGVHDPALRFLDPYGAETGELWRGFLAVLEREIDREELADLAQQGAVEGFRHAERVLCGELS